MRYVTLPRWHAIVQYAYMSETYAALVSPSKGSGGLDSLLRKKRTRLKEKKSRLTEGMHDPDDVSGLLTIIFERAGRAGVRIEKTVPGRPVHIDAYVHYPIVMNIEANYTALGRFVSALETLPHLFRVTRIALEADKSGRVTARLRLLCMLKSAQKEAE
jgi:Tfp pilus assembly protein PilO